MHLGYKMGGAKGAPQEPSVNMSLVKKIQCALTNKPVT